MDRLAAIALGGNSTSVTGPAAKTIAAALGDITRDIGAIVAVSRFFRTPAFPLGSGPEFVNAAVVASTALDPGPLLAALHRIEARYGRMRTVRWGPRTLDLDLVAMGDLVLPDAATLRAWIGLPPDEQGRVAPDRLILPHPRLQDRGFVLIPLAEVAPLWRHPLTGLSVAEMADALPEAEKAAVRPL